MMKYNFDEKLNKDYEIRRKWDYKLVKDKFGKGVKSDFLPFWIADNDFLTPPALQDRLVEFIKNSNMGYTYLLDDFYNSIISWQERRHDAKILKEWINITYGTVSALHLINQALLNRNDKIIIPTPSYEPFKMAAINNEIEIVLTSLECIENRYYFNYNDIEEKIKKEKPKLFILCNPQNPSGRVWMKKEIIKIAQICLDNDVILVSDEVHSEMIFKGEHCSALCLDEKFLNNLIVLTSPNKAFNLGGLKTSYSVIPNEKIRSIIEKQMKKNSITSPNIIGLISLITAYNECEDWLIELNKYIYNNYLLLKNCFEKLEKIEIHQLESSYLVWINLENTGKNSKWWTEILAENGILVEAGEDFIADGEKFIRINVATQREHIIKLIEKIEGIYNENFRNIK